MCDDSAFGAERKFEGSNPNGDIHFHFDLFSIPFLSSQLGEANASKYDIHQG